MIKGKTPFVSVKITDEMKEKARKKATEMGKLRNAIMSGEKSLVGFLGEEIVNDYLMGDISNTYEYDIVVDGETIDVKTKDTTVYPSMTYEVSVASYNTKQKCDYYVFVRILNTLTVGWILGYMPKKEYYEKARFLKKGDVDGTNNFVVRADCWNMYISDLYRIENFKKLQ